MDDVTALDTMEEPLIDAGETADLTPDTEVEEPGEGREAKEGGDPEESIDGRRMPSKVQAALKALRDTSPEHAAIAKTLKDDYGRYQAIREIAPNGVNEIRSWKTALDAAGGLEGVASLQEQVNSLEQSDTLLAAGNPAFFDSLPEAMQAGLAKIAPAYLARLEETNPQAFIDAVKPHFASALASTGVGDVLENLGAALEAGDGKTAAQLAGMLSKWFADQVKGAGQAGAARPDQLSSERAKLEEERAEFESGKDKDFWGGLGSTLATHENAQFDKFLAPYLKTLNLSDTAKEGLKRDFKDELGKRGKADAAYMKQMAAYRSQKSGRDAERITGYVKQNIDLHAKAAVDEVVKARYGSFLSQRKPAPKVGLAKVQPTTASAAVRVSEKPSYDKWDNARTTKQMIYAKQCYLTNGKLVSWA